MTPAEYAFIISQIFLSRAVSTFASFCLAVFWLLFAIIRGW
jgi:hypothetical protein